MTLASFSFDGTVPLSKERLIMWVIRGENSAAFSFTIFGCILSSPQDFFTFNFINSLYTSLVSAGLRKKLHWLQFPRNLAKLLPFFIFLARFSPTVLK